MKRYLKPSVTVENVEVTCGICAGSDSAIHSDGNGNTIVNPNPDKIKDGGDAAEALSKGYITHFDVWEEKWPDEL